MLVVKAEIAPIAIDTDGVARISKTRVTLDTIVSAFEQGSTAEEIVYRYPVLQLSDVYHAIGFYLNHQEEVAAYLHQRHQEAQAVRTLRGCLKRVNSSNLCYQQQSIDR